VTTFTAAYEGGYFDRVFRIRDVRGRVIAERKLGAPIPQFKEVQRAEAVRLGSRMRDGSVGHEAGRD